ncbi:MAG TPA: hypothetical protein VFC60_00450 [Tissierellaceae bacterium]|nr:hypothetical protein [Tissierellaceae bacterium]
MNKKEKAVKFSLTPEELKEIVDLAQIINVSGTELTKKWKELGDYKKVIQWLDTKADQMIDDMYKQQLDSFTRNKKEEE